MADRKPVSYAAAAATATVSTSTAAPATASTSTAAPAAKPKLTDCAPAAFTTGVAVTLHIGVEHVEPWARASFCGGANSVIPCALFGGQALAEGDEVTVRSVNGEDIAGGDAPEYVMSGHVDEILPDGGAVLEWYSITVTDA